MHKWFLPSHADNLILALCCVAVQVREATSNDPWGPSSSLMSEIADLTYNVVAFSEIMSMVWKRLNDHGKNWRHVYKVCVTIHIGASYQTTHGNMCLCVLLYDYIEFHLLELVKEFCFISWSQCYDFFWTYQTWLPRCSCQKTSLVFLNFVPYFQIVLTRSE